jgi:hypothetical protein
MCLSLGSAGNQVLELCNLSGLRLVLLPLILRFAWSRTTALTYKPVVNAIRYRVESECSWPSGRITTLKP